MKIAPTHDEMLIDSDGKLCGYATAVPNGTRVLAGHARPTVRAAAPDPTAPGAETPKPAPSPIPRPSGPGEGINREHIRSMAARLGHLPPANLDEATYPKEWFAPSERERLGGAV